MSAVREARGAVTAGDDGPPLARVQVEVEGLGIRAITGSRGNFDLRSVPAGSHQVSFSCPGYRPTSSPVTVAAGESAGMEVQLEIRSLEVDGMTVEGLRWGSQSGALTEGNRRASSSVGWPRGALG